MRRSSIPLVLLAVLSFFAGLGRGAIADADEAFYAESAREMVASGDWITPSYNFEPRFQKPALYYWLAAASYLVTGPTEFAARLWSAFAGLGLVLVTASAARRWCDEDVSFLAGAIVATNFGYFSMARMALPDLPLTFFITLSVYAALVAIHGDERRPRPWLLLAAVSAALGFLTKGPVALIIPTMVIAPIVLIERRSTRLQFSDIILAVVVFAALALPWYVVMWMRHGSAYLEGFFIGDNYERFATARFNDPRPWWFYLPVIAGGLLPWTPLTMVWISPVVQYLTRRRDISGIDLRFLLWALVPLVFYTISVGKQPRYILPILPPLALLLAGSIIERTREWRSLDGARVRPRRNRAVAVGCFLSGLFLTLLAFLIFRIQTLFVDVADGLTLTASATIALVGLLVVACSVSSAWRAAPVLLAGAAALVFAVLPWGVLSSPRDSAVSHIATMLRDVNADSRPVATYGVLVRNLVFYSRIKQTDLIDDDHLAAFVAQNPTALIVLSGDELVRLTRERGIKLEPLVQYRYFDEGQIKVGTLVRPNADDLQTVVLARVPNQGL